MLKVDRKKWIENYLLENGSLVISKVKKEMKCSEETLRKDIIELEKEGKLIKIHGGAYLPDINDKSYPINIREILMIEEKIYMSNLAVRYITDNMTIFLDSSTTCQEIVSKIIEQRLKVNIITNAMPIVNMCENFNNINVILLGGKFRKRNKSFVGYFTTDMMNSFYVDIAFVSFPTFNMKLGLGDNDLEELKVREKMIENSKKTYLIMDNTKFYDNSSTVYTKNIKYDLIITDKKLDDEWEKFLENKIVYE